MMNTYMISEDAGVPLSASELNELKRFPTPTIANAIETFGIRGRLEGVTNTGIRCLFPQMGVMLGYAVTAVVCTAVAPAKHRRVDRREYWRAIANAPRPTVTVMQDISETHYAYWGEVNSNMHKALGSIGLLTNGAVRDLDEVGELEFHFFASGVAVSHGWAHLEDFNCPVQVFGMTVQPGDLIHADQHGAVTIPREIARLVAQACRDIETAERKIISICKSNEATVEALHELVTPDY